MGIFTSKLSRPSDLLQMPPHRPALFPCFFTHVYCPPPNRRQPTGRMPAVAACRPRDTGKLQSTNRRYRALPCRYPVRGSAPPYCEVTTSFTLPISTCMIRERQKHTPSPVVPSFASHAMHLSPGRDNHAGSAQGPLGDHPVSESSTRALGAWSATQGTRPDMHSRDCLQLEAADCQDSSANAEFNGHNTAPCPGRLADRDGLQ